MLVELRLIRGQWAALCVVFLLRLGLIGFNCLRLGKIAMLTEPLV